MLQFLLLLLSSGNGFVFKLEIPPASQKVLLPLRSINRYELTIDWGDGIVESCTSVPVLHGHTYNTSGTMTVNITGRVYEWGGGESYQYYLTEIVSWGEFVVQGSVVVGMFQDCINLKTISASDQPTFIPGATLQSAFSGCTLLNSPIRWDLNNAVNSLDYMFSGTSSFDSLIVFTNTSNVTSTVRMFANSVFNQPFSMDTSAVTTMECMFCYSQFNQNLTLNTSQVNRMVEMFMNSSFNSLLNIDTRSVIEMTGMFNNNIAFNSDVNFSTANVVSMEGMFNGATNFSKKINFDASSLGITDFMFSYAYSFNAEVYFYNATRLTTVQRMFQGATAFNKDLNFSSSPISNANALFQNASSFNSNILFSPAATVTRAYAMFQGAVSFAKTLTLNVSVLNNVESMFDGAQLFTQDLSSWTLPKLCAGDSACLNFCPVCGPPSFQTGCPTCTPIYKRANGANACGCAPWEYQNASQCVLMCSGPGYTFDDSHCQCSFGYTGAVSYVNNTASGCIITPELQLCELTQLGPGLQSECVITNTNASEYMNASQPTPAPIISRIPKNGTILSPVVNITRLPNSSVSTSEVFVFTLPINPQVVRQVVTQNCYGAKVNCEWQDPKTLEFQASGCTVSAENLPLSDSASASGEALVGVQCTCSHLTVFAVVLREELQQEALCQAEVQDYVFIGLYVVLAAVALIQLTRLVLAKAYKISFAHHTVLLFATVMRIVYLVAKPLISSFAGLVFLGLLPSVSTLCVFVHVLLTWASLKLFTMTSSPFAKFRIPLIAVIGCVMFILVAVTIAVAAADSSMMQRDVVINGSYLLAAIYALVCIMIIWSGVGLTSMLTNSSIKSISGGSKTSMSHIQTRVLTASLGLGICLLLAACLWVAAVQEQILDSVAATLGVSIAFYAVDSLSLLVLLVLFAPGVRAAAVKSRHDFR